MDTGDLRIIKYDLQDSGASGQGHGDLDSVYLDPASEMEGL